LTQINTLDKQDNPPPFQARESRIVGVLSVVTDSQAFDQAMKLKQMDVKIALHDVFNRAILPLLYLITA
jgi:hypothetical protein